MQAGPSAEDLIIASRHRLLGLVEARDANAAAREMEDHMARLCRPSAVTAFAYADENHQIL